MLIESALVVPAIKFSTQKQRMKFIYKINIFNFLYQEEATGSRKQSLLSNSIFGTTKLIEEHKFVPCNTGCHLIMETASTSKTLVIVYQTTRSHDPEDGHFQHITSLIII